jgi:sugar lactone lactonase YvrE
MKQMLLNFKKRLSHGALSHKYVSMRFACLLLLSPILLGQSIEVKGQDVSTIAGTGVAGFGGDGGPAIAAKLNSPWGMAISGTNLYVADFANNRVRIINLITGVIKTFAGNGVAGFSGDGGLAVAAQLNGPTGIGVDGVGNVYIADVYNHRIRRVDAAGIIKTVAGNGGGGFTGDGGPAVLAEIGMVNGLDVDVRMVAGGIINTIAGTPWTPGFAGDGGPALGAELNYVNDVLITPAGDLFIADLGNQRIRSVMGGTINTFAGNGTMGFAGDLGPAIAAEIHNPAGMAWGCQRTLFFCDVDNNRIRKVDPSGIINTLAGSGAAGFADGPALTAQFNRPIKVVFDGCGNMYVTDFVNNRVRKISGSIVGPEIATACSTTYTFASVCGYSLGGTWSSSNTAVATIGETTGILTGVSTGTTIIDYTYGSGCSATKTVTVNPPPPASACLWTAAPLNEINITSIVGGPLVGVWFDCYADGGTTPLPGSPVWHAGTGPITTLGLPSGTHHICLTFVDNGCLWPATCCMKFVTPAPRAAPTSTATTTIVRNSPELAIVPNPNTGTFKLSGHLQVTNLKEVTIEIDDMLGKALHTQTVSVKNGGIEENIAMREVANGVYMIKIKGDNVSQVLRFVVDK